jgi:hypothetical protein
MARQEGGQCSIGLMRARMAWLGGAIGVVGAAAYRALRRQPARVAAVDPRAEELRRRLDESRELVDERDEFESAETPVDQAEPAEVADRRQAVHERGRAAAEEMRGESGPR